MYSLDGWLAGAAIVFQWQNMIMILGIGILGYYYVAMAIKGVSGFYMPTVWGRFAVLVFLVILSALKQIKPTAILFGIVDAAGAVWTLVTVS